MYRGIRVYHYVKSHVLHSRHSPLPRLLGTSKQLVMIFENREWTGLTDQSYLRPSYSCARCPFHTGTAHRRSWAPHLVDLLFESPSDAHVMEKQIVVPSATSVRDSRCGVLIWQSKHTEGRGNNLHIIYVSSSSVVARTRMSTYCKGHR